MTNGEVRRVSLQDIQLVQNLIERCLQLYMSEREVVNTLLHQAKIEPGFTELVWQKLETENRDFFRAYHMRLIVKEQISRFNQLLEKQVDLMHQVCQTGVSSISLSNGSQMHSRHNNSAYHVPEPSGPPIKSESMQQAVYTNGVNNMPENMLLAQNTNSGIGPGMIKSEGGFVGDSRFMFGADPFGGGEQIETSSFGLLGQIPRNFSLSDLTAGFSNSTDILESYSRSPFLVSEANFLDPHITGEQQDVTRLDTISEGLSYDDFASD